MLTRWYTQLTLFHSSLTRVSDNFIILASIVLIKAVNYFPDTTFLKMRLMNRTLIVFWLVLYFLWDKTQNIPFFSFNQNNLMRSKTRVHSSFYSNFLKTAIFIEFFKPRHSTSLNHKPKIKTSKLDLTHFLHLFSNLITFTFTQHQGKNLTYHFPGLE